MVLALLVFAATLARGAVALQGEYGVFVGIPLEAEPCSALRRARAGNRAGDHREAPSEQTEQAVAAPQMRRLVGQAGLEFGLVQLGEGRSGEG